MANCKSRNVTVLAVEEGKARVIGHVDVGNEAAAADLSMKGSRAFVTKNKVSVLGMEGRNVS